MYMKDKYFLVDVLRIVSKIQISDEEKNFLKRYFENITEDKFSILTLYRNRIEYLFAYHFFQISKEYKCDNKILKAYVRAIDSQIGYLQYKYEEYIHEITLLIDCLEKNNIRYVVLKGFSLMDELYKIDGIVYRNFTDCDFLIAKDDVAAVHKILTELDFAQGYIGLNNEIEYASRSEIIYWSMASHQEFPYIKKMKIQTNSPYKVVNIDVNTSILEGGLSKTMLSTGFILEHRKKIKCGGTYCWGLSKEFQLIQLCYHFYKDTVYEAKIATHSSLTLIKFCDIREYLIISKNSIDWELFLRLINEYGIAFKVLIALDMIAQYYSETELTQLVNRLANASDVTLRKYDKDFWLQLIHCSYK